MAKKLQRTIVRKRAAAAPPGQEPSARRPRGRRRVSDQLVNDFTVQLATLSEAGIPVVRALTILEGQTRPGPFKNVLADLVEDVSSGTPLSEAMAKHEGVFDRLYASMVRAGEAGGVLDRVLQRLAQYRERIAEIRAKVLGALIYPAVIVIVAVAVVSAVIV
jgi:type IV pilus assembly protein PilC